MLPAGGTTGTIRNAYKTDNGQVFIWAKQDRYQTIITRAATWLPGKENDWRSPS